MPNDQRTMLLRHTGSMLQIVVVIEHKPISDASVQVTPLKQPCFQDVIECARLETTTRVTNQQLGYMCFLCHVKDMLLGKHECYGLSNVHVIRHSLSLMSNSIKEINNFKTFSDEHEGFAVRHGSDLARNTWNGLEAIKSVLTSTLSKSMERVGAAFNSIKSQCSHYRLMHGNV